MEEKKLMVKYTKDEDIYKKLEKLYKYLFDNKIGLKLYNLREKINMPKASVMELNTGI